jgi:two-component system nitrate/nitrite response regulator NarL
MIAVLIIADILLYREGLARVLSESRRITVVGGAANAEEAIEDIDELQPGIVLLDVAATDGPSAVRSILNSAPDAKIVALGVTESEADVIAYAEAGASGYVPRHGTSSDLEAVIESAARGEALCSPRIAGSLLRHVADLAAERGWPPDENRLTSREVEIARLIDEGLSNKEIAHRLCITVSTVKNHVHNILDKLQIHCRAEVPARFR